MKVYTNQPAVALYVNGQKAEEKTGDKVFAFQIPLNGTVTVEARAGALTDTAAFTKVDAPDPSYRLQKSKSTSANWV